MKKIKGFFLILITIAAIVIISFSAAYFFPEHQTVKRLKNDFLNLSQKLNWKILAESNNYNKKNPIFLDFNGNYSPIFESSGKITQISISPDNEKIIFEENEQLIVADSTGENRKILMEKYWGKKLSSSPSDQNKLAFLDDYSYEDSSFSLYLFDIEKKEKKLIVKNFISALPEPAFSWSPDGKNIAFTSLEGKLMFINLEDLKVREIYDDYGTALAWSPDGNYLIYKNNRFEIKKSPNGESKIAEKGSGKYYILNLQYKTKKELIQKPLYQKFTEKFSEVYSQPLWSPDSNYVLLFKSYNPGIKTDFWIIDIDNGFIVYNFKSDLTPSSLYWFQNKTIENSHTSDSTSYSPLSREHY